MTQRLESDHVDSFLEAIELVFPELDLEVEGIVDRIGGLSKRLNKTLDETLAEFGLDSGDHRVLSILSRSGAPYRSSPGRLARRLEITSGSMTSRLDRLEKAGLVRRLPDPDDRRGVLIELTDEGRETYKRAVGVQAKKEELVASALDEGEKRELNALLRRLMLEFERREGGAKAGGATAAAEAPTAPS